MYSLYKVTAKENKYPAKLIKRKIKSGKLQDLIWEIREQVLKTTSINLVEFQIKDQENNLIQSYDSCGELMEDYNFETKKPFKGNNNPKFKVGDIVEYIGYKELKLGIITAVPVTEDEIKSKKWDLDESDNVYVIDFSKNVNEHQHPHESMIRNPRFKVSKAQEKKLKEALIFLEKTNPIITRQ